MLGLKVIRVSKRGPWSQLVNENDIFFTVIIKFRLIVTLSTSSYSVFLFVFYLLCKILSYFLFPSSFFSFPLPALCYCLLSTIVWCHLMSWQLPWCWPYCFNILLKSAALVSKLWPGYDLLVYQDTQLWKWSTFCRPYRQIYFPHWKL